MATNRNLRTDLLAKLGCSPQALSQRAKIIKRDYGPMATEDAHYLIAYKEGIDISKYLDISTVDKVRGFLQKEGAVKTAQLKTKNPRGKTVLVKIAMNVPAIDAMLSTSLAEDMKKMARLYPLQYMPANSLRVVISRVLEKRYKANWWETCVEQKTKDKVKGRREKEAKEP
jgi:hypothetical protein